MKTTVLYLALASVAVACSGEEEFRPTGGPTGNTRIVMGLEFVEVSAGQFTMGASMPGPLGVLANWPITAQPKHPVTIGKPFWISRTEVTNAMFMQFAKVTGEPEHPVTGVSFEKAEAFCRWLTEKADGTFRLPSEAEWEYCCRAGSEEVFSWGEDEAEVEKHAWVESTSGGAIHPVARKLPNAWGLFDFHGNAMEWVADRWHTNYQGAPPDGSAWTDGLSKKRIIRGGSYRNPPSHARAGLRLAVAGGDEVPEEAVGIRIAAEFE
jgi:formylglycine-generating enzyme required for sulfatase activity